MNYIWLLRAKRWLQHPPSPRRIKLVFGVIGLCIAIVAIEYFFGLPDWMRAYAPQRVPRF